MIWGIKDNQRIKATPKNRAICELCQQELIAKCGEIKIWHWAHKSKMECDPWWEPESEWHINWKNEFPSEQQEIMIIKKGAESYIDDYDMEGNVISHKKCFFMAPENLDKDLLKKCIIKKHRADILTNNLVIELQSTPLSPEKIEEREEFYDNMIWLLNGEKLTSGLELRWKKNIITFRWKHPPKSWWFAKKLIYIDISEIYHFKNTKFTPIFLIKKIYNNIPCGGWGILMTKEQFLNGVKNGEKTI